MLVSEIKFNPLTINIMKSINTFSLSGRLTSDARFFDSKNGKVARFSIAHNFAQGGPALFIDAVMFPKSGSKEVTIPEDILKKGTPVIVSGYMKPASVAKDKEAKPRQTIDMVVTSCDPQDEAEGAE